MKNEELVVKIRDKVKNVIVDNNLINNGDTIVVGVSGGPDSMCLLDILCYLNKEGILKFSIVVAHVNHMIRKEAYDDKLYVENFCKKLNIPFYYKEANITEIAKKEHISEETCGRNIRYDFLNEICNNFSSSKIAIAHNLDDNVETIILNLIRGCGLKGLTGMKYSYKNIIRPLLDIEKKDILEYNILMNINPCFDKTNNIDIYSRNKVRLNLLPMLKNEYNPNIMESIIRMKHILELDEDFLNEYTQKILNICILKNNTNEITFDFLYLLKEHKSIQRRIIRKIIELKTGTIDGVENVHIIDILKLLNNGITGKKYILGNKFTIKIINKHTAIIY